MVSHTMLLKTSTILGMIMSEVKGIWEDKPFGGMNMIMSGDFHQFPPVRGGWRATLYWPSTAIDCSEEAVGSTLYARFKMVVILKEQICMTDKKWNQLLQHA